MFGRINKIIEKMARAIFNALLKEGSIVTAKEELKLEVEKLVDGGVICTLKGATTHENNQFLNCLQEMLEPVENPRYLIIRPGKLRRKLGLSNYHAVPTIFGKKKETAALFFKYWRHHVGRSKLTFTRNRQGRKLLLKARLYHIKHELEEKTKKSVSWR